MKVHTRREFTRRSFPEWLTLRPALDPDGRYSSAKPLPDGWVEVVAKPGSLSGVLRLPSAVLTMQESRNLDEHGVIVPVWLAPMVDRQWVTRDRAYELLTGFGPIGAPGRAAIGAAYAVGGLDAYRAALASAMRAPEEQLTLRLWR